VFSILYKKFRALSYTKIKEGIFVGPDIRKLMKDDMFEATRTEVEKDDRTSFKEVVTKYFGNTKDPSVEDIIGTMLTKFRSLGYSMSLKVHFLFSHLD